MHLPSVFLTVQYNPYIVENNPQSYWVFFFLVGGGGSFKNLLD